MKILSFGEVLWDVYPEDKFIGGAPLNFSAHLAKHGGEVYLLSAVGDDELGDNTLSEIKKRNIHTEHIVTVNDKPTGRCLVTLDEHSVPSYNLLSDVAWDYIDNKTALSEKFDVLYFGTLALRSAYNSSSLRSLLEKGNFKEIFADVNIRPPFFSRESISLAMSNATILKISDEELELTLGEIGIEYSDNLEELSKQISERFPQIKVLIITRGSKGSCAYDGIGGNFYTASSVKVNAVSTVGAGDSFSAAFIYKYLNGSGIEECLDYASKVAAFVVSKYDAIPEYNINDFK